MFDISAAALPTLRTRQALLILDPQNEFLSQDGALTVSQPDALISRILHLARAFRLSGAGDVIWISSQYDRHRPLSDSDGGGGDQIITSDAPVIPRRSNSAGSSRGRHATSGRHEAAVMEADEEAFLSYPPGCSKTRCVQPGSSGVELVPAVRQVVDSDAAGRDITFTKTHYSAFAAAGAAGSNQHSPLVQMLRGRFVTEIYVCGALTNISVYATALDAGRHGYDITLVDDCCGYRSDMRHSNAVRRLVELTGCEVTTAAQVVAKLTPERPSSKDRELGRRRGRGGNPNDGPDTTVRTNNSAGREKTGTTSGDRAEKPAVGRPSPEDEGEAEALLPSSLEKLTLSGDDASPAPDSAQGTPSGSSRRIAHAAGAVAPPDDRPHSAASHRRQPLQPVVETDSSSNPASTPSTSVLATPSEINNSNSSTSSSRNKQPQVMYVDSAALEVDPDLSSSAGATQQPGSDDDPLELQQLDIGQKLSYLRSRHAQGAPRVRQPPTTSSRAAAANGTANARSASFKAQRRSSQSASPDISLAASPKTQEHEQTAMDEQQQEHLSNQTVSTPLCEGDTTIITSLLPPSLADGAFSLLKSEVKWQHMSHQGGEVPRLVAVQGLVEADGMCPAYRHPADESPALLPFSPTVEAIRAHVEKAVGHELNHVLIQLYRSGTDYISEHSDKTLDIVRGSYIANVSLGAERTMVFRTKRADKDPSLRRKAGDAAAAVAAAGGKAVEEEDIEEQPVSKQRQTVRAALPHNSLVRMGPRTNARWLHSIRADKRLDIERSSSEKAFEGERISLTFRHIGTFLSPAPASSSSLRAESSSPSPGHAERQRQSHNQGQVIWGQGATFKTRASARPVQNGQSPEAVALLRAFGAENHSSNFDWELYYGKGFDVWNISASPRLFASADRTVNLAVAIQLAELGVAYAKGSSGSAGTGSRGAVIRFVDSDESRAAVEGWVAVMGYLDVVYGGQQEGKGSEAKRDEVARRMERFWAALGLLDVWREWLGKAMDGEGLREMRREMERWAAWAAESEEGDGKKMSSGGGSGGGYIAGGERLSIADFAFWPVLHEILDIRPDFIRGLKHLEAYYARMRESKAVVKVMGDGRQYETAVRSGEGRS